MKQTLISFSIAIALLSSCTPTAKKEAEDTAVKTASVDSLTHDKLTKVGGGTAAIPKVFSALIPIDLLNAKSSDVYEKYGIEFSGNCYACDLASVAIVENKMTWTNVCDDKDTFEVAGFTFEVEANKSIFTTTDRTYILTQIDQAPVFELTIVGKKLELNNKRVSKYFTTKEALPLFKENDCGEFEG